MKKTDHPILMLRPGGPVWTSHNRVTNRIVPLSLRYCAALLRQKGYLTVELDGFVRPIKPSSLKRWAEHHKPSIAVVSIEKFQHVDLATLFGLVSALKEAVNTKIIIFGPFPTFFPDMFLSDNVADAVLLGEPESSVVQTIDKLLIGEKVSLSSVATVAEQNKNPSYVKDVDTLPFPLRLKGDTEKYYCNYPLPIFTNAVWGSMLAGRGCKRACTFCSPFDRITFSRKLRPRAIDKIQAEALDLCRSGVNVISFEDDDPTFSRKRSFALSEAMEAVPAGYVCHARVDELDEDVIYALADSGCVMLKIGVESGSPAMIEQLKKGEATYWYERTIQMTRIAATAGIAVCGLFIIGSPGETELDIEQTQQLMLKAPFDLIQLHFFTPYPGSPFHKAMKNAPGAKETIQFHHYESDTVEFAAVSEMDPDEVEQWSRKMFIKFVGRPGYIAKHIWRFGGFYLKNPKIFARLFSGVTSWTSSS